MSQWLEAGLWGLLEGAAQLVGAFFGWFAHVSQRDTNLATLRCGELAKANWARHSDIMKVARRSDAYVRLR